MTGQIEDIQKWAAEIAGDSLHAQQLMIAGWSAFRVEGGKTISILGQELEDVSPGWLKQIWYKGRKAHESHVLSKATVDLFDLVPQMPRPLVDGPSNHPKDLPF